MLSKVVLLHFLFGNLPRSRRCHWKGNAGIGVPDSAGTSHLPRGSPSLASPHQTHSGHGINHQFARVELRRDTKFGSSVIEGVLVVPVVPAFSDGAPRDKGVFGGVGKDIIRVVTVQVSGRVDAPGKVKNNDVSKGSSNEKGVPEILAPVVLGDLSGKDKAHVQSEPGVEFLLPVYQRIGQQIRKVHFASGLDDRGVLFDNEPTNVSVEKSASSVVGIRLGFREFVVDSVITSPMVDRSLVGDRVAEHENSSEQKVGLIRTVRPQPMHSDCYSKATDWPQKEGPHQSFGGTLCHFSNSNSTCVVNQRDVDDHWPIEVSFFVVVLDQPREFHEHFR